MKRILAVLAALILLCSLPARGEEEPELLIMLYMTGSDLETEGGAASRDLEEIMAALPKDGSVEVAALLSGSEKWRLDVDEEETSLYRVTGRGIEKVSAHPLANMGEAQTLASFVNEAWELYPARERALILWDHGAGPVLGVCFDQLHTADGGMDGLTLSELSDALSRTPAAQEPLLLVGFDACLMACAETAWAVTPFARYMIASQELESGDGWNYAFLRDAAGLSGEELCRRVVDGFMEASQKSLAPATLSAVDLTKMDDLAREMSEFFGSIELNRDAYTAMARGRVDTKSVACAAPVSYDLIDLKDMLEVLQSAGTECSDLMEALDRAVIYNGSNTPFLNGMSLYYPFYNKSRYVSPWGSLYGASTFSEGYAKYLEQFTGIWLSDSLADWSGQSMTGGQSGQRAIFTLQLTPEQMDQLASARLMVLGRVDLGVSMENYYFVYSSNDVSVSPSGLVAASYNGDCLIVENGDGEPMSGALTYNQLEDGGLGIRAVVFKGDILDDDFDSQAAYLYYVPDGDGGWALARCLRLGGDETQSGRSDIDLSEWDRIELLSRLRNMEYDEDGDMLPFWDWESTTRLTGYSIEKEYVGGDLSGLVPRFVPLQDGKDRYAYLELTDLQNHVTCTPLFAMDNPTRQTVARDLTLIDNEYCTLTLDRAEAVMSMDDGVVQYFTAVNHTDQTIKVKCVNVRMDHIWAADSSYPWFELEPGATMTFQKPIEPLDVQALRVSVIDTIYCTLSITDGEDAELTRVEAQVPMRLDMRAFYEPIEDEVISSAAWRDLDIELIGVVRDDPEVYYPQIRFQFRLTNRGKEPVSFGTDALYVNGFGDFTAFTPVGDGFIERWWEMPGDCVGYMELNRDMDMIRCPVESVGFFMETPDENGRAKSRDWIEFAVPGEGDEP